MNLENFELELDAALAALTDEQLRAELESFGCVFEEPWLDAFLEGVDLVTANSEDCAAFEAADSSELALAA